MINITRQEFNKFTTKHLAARLKWANLVSEADIDYFVERQIFTMSYKSWIKDLLQIKRNM